MTSVQLRDSARVLVVALRRLGDVLLTTPLIRSLRRGFPQAQIDALVFSGTEGILAGNPDLSAILTLPARPSPFDGLAMVRRLWRHYDLAVSTQSGDRPTFLAWAAGRQCVGPVGAGGPGSAIKRRLLDRSIVDRSDLHRVTELLRLTDLLEIPAIPEVVCPTGYGDIMPGQPPYAVIHAGPMFKYKRWTREGWRELARLLAGRGLELFATGGAQPAERSYLDAVWSGIDIRRLDGRLAWNALTALLNRARIYVGPDTSVTHLAAASGCPTIALYGPTDPRRWGPWPVGGLTENWVAAGRRQRRANVWLVQNPLPCLPCQLEGCRRHIASHSRCLDELSVSQVLEAVDEAMAWQPETLNRVRSVS